MRKRQIARPHARGERRSGDEVWSGPILIFELHDAYADRGPGHSAPLQRGRYRRTREPRSDGTGCTAKRNGALVGMAIPRSGKGLDKAHRCSVDESVRAYRLCLHLARPPKLAAGAGSDPLGTRGPAPLGTRSPASIGRQQASRTRSWALAA